jgi:hypothetical protein
MVTSILLILMVLPSVYATLEYFGFVKLASAENIEPLKAS